MEQHEPATSRPRLPPRWFIRTFWTLHRFLYRASGGSGLRRPVPGEVAGMLRLLTVGRRTGQERTVIVSYWEDGPNLVTLAMNGWDDPPPAWWLNLLAHPDAEVETVDGPRLVRGREAEGAERERLWSGFRRNNGWGDVDEFSALRSRETPIVVLEPR